MLAVTHALIGAVAGRRAGGPRRAASLGVLSHALADGVAHDDGAIGPAGQALLGGAALAMIHWRCGRRSPAMIGALGGALPDAEVALYLLRGRPASARLLFPSHWQRNGSRSNHPYQFPVPALHIAAELCVVAALTAYLLMARAADTPGGPSHRPRLRSAR